MNEEKQFQMTDNAGRHVALPSPNEWARVTSIRLSSRSVEWRKVDAAYRVFHEAMKRPDAVWAQYQAGYELKSLLNTIYLKEGGWPCSRRNIQSDGLVERLFNALDRYLGEEFRHHRTVEWDRFCDARFGVLWLLSDLKVTQNPLAIGADALDCIGTMIPVAQASEAVASHPVMSHYAGMVTGVPGCGSSVLRAVDPVCHVSDDTRPWYEKIYEKLKEVIVGYCKELWNKMRSFLTFEDFTWAKLSGYIQTAVDWVMKVTPSMCRNIYTAVKDGHAIGKIIYQRFQLNSQASSFEPAGQTAFYLDAVRRAQREMITSKGASMLMSVFSVLSTAFGHAAAGLAKALAQALIWIYKTVTQYLENRRIQRFLEKAIAMFRREPLDHAAPGEHDGGGSVRPLKSGNGMARDPRRFDAFFAEGCRASPLIPLLLMNTPVCKAAASSFAPWEEKKYPPGAPGPRSSEDKTLAFEQPYFNRAVACFESVRTFASDFLLRSGFRFSARSENACTQELINLALRRPKFDVALPKSSPAVT